MKNRTELIATYVDKNLKILIEKEAKEKKQSTSTFVMTILKHYFTQKEK